LTSHLSSGDQNGHLLSYKSDAIARYSGTITNPHN